MDRIVTSAIRMVMYGYNQGSLRKHFLNAGTSIVIPKTSPKITRNMNPMVCVAKPDLIMVEISVKSFKQLGFTTTMHTSDNFDIRRSDHIGQFI